jgi:hypothetical protein
MVPNFVILDPKHFGPEAGLDKHGRNARFLRDIVAQRQRLI